MSRNKKQLKDWQYNYVTATIRGYCDRERYIASCINVTSNVARRYIALNRAVDDGFIEAIPDERLRFIVRRAIVDAMPYDNIYGLCVGRNFYYTLRRNCVNAVARQLGII